MLLAIDRSEHKAILLLMSGIESNPGPVYHTPAETCVQTCDFKRLEDRVVGLEEQHAHDTAWLTTAIDSILMILCEQQTQRTLYCMEIEEHRTTAM